METPKSSLPLQGLGVVITRPKAQAQGLAEKIRCYGGNPLLYPALVIEFITENPSLNTVLQQLSHYQKAIFTSANAVHGTLPSLRAVCPTVPPFTCCAVGQSTAELLQAEGWPRVTYPTEESSSEGLLALPLFNAIHGEKIVIFSGEGGRDTLENTLKQRGADVHKIAVYRRRCSTEPCNFLLDHWTQGRIDVVLSTSNESLLCFHHQLGSTGQRYLQQTPLLVISENMAKTAKELGYGNCLITAADAKDNTVLDTLLAWRAQGKEHV